MVLSTQVMTRQGVPGQSSALSDNPVTVTFKFDAVSLLVEWLIRLK